MRQFRNIIVWATIVATIAFCGCNKEKENKINLSGQGQLSGHEWVDLGLPSGTLWATCNIGANAPEDFGDYFAWGETTPMTEYGNHDYSITYYNTSTMEILPEYDAVKTLWGDGWQMPTPGNFQELVAKCSFKWIKYKGTEGYLITGSNGKSIYLAAGGSFGDDGIAVIGRDCNFWTNIEDDNSLTAAYATFFDYYRTDILGCDHSYGLSIRPVCKVVTQ